MKTNYLSELNEVRDQLARTQHVLSLTFPGEVAAREELTREIMILTLRIELLTILTNN